MPHTCDLLQQTHLLHCHTFASLHNHHLNLLCYVSSVPPLSAHTPRPPAPLPPAPLRLLSCRRVFRLRFSYCTCGLQQHCVPTAVMSKVHLLLALLNTASSIKALPQAAPSSNRQFLRPSVVWILISAPIFNSFPCNMSSCKQPVPGTSKAPALAPRHQQLALVHPLLGHCRKRCLPCVRPIMCIRSRQPRCIRITPDVGANTQKETVHEVSLHGVQTNNNTLRLKCAKPLRNSKHTLDKPWVCQKLACNNVLNMGVSTTGSVADCSGPTPAGPWQSECGLQEHALPGCHQPLTAEHPCGARCGHPARAEGQ